MKRTMLLLLAALVVIAGCNAPAGDYDKDVDKYVRNHEPKTGGPDL